MQKTELLCIGNALVDVFTRVDSAFLERFRIAEPVQHIERECIDSMLGELGAGEAVYCSGGGAANAAKIAAMLGINAAFAGAVGQDSLADIFEKELTEAGAVALLKKTAAKTGACLMLAMRKAGAKSILFKENAETRIAASPAAALEFSEADLDEALIAGADAVALDGFILERTPLIRRILHLASRSGVPVALDVASVDNVRQKTEEILQYCRTYPLFVFMNVDEAIAFYNRITKMPDDESLNEREKEAMILEEVCSLLKVVSNGDIFPVFAIKMGGRGAVVVAGGTVYREETFAIRPRDAVGAGDAFCAAFLAAWIRGKSLSECAALGNKVAREILEVPGTKIRPEKLKAFAKQLR